MFDYAGQITAWKSLMKSSDEAEFAPACENYPDAFFPEKGASGLAQELKWAIDTCKECPIMKDCANYAIKYERHGVWGGMTAEERKTARRAMNLELVE